MGNMRFKAGDRVKIKSLDWYNENKDERGDVICGNVVFWKSMQRFCGRIVTIIDVDEVQNMYTAVLKKDYFSIENHSAEIMQLSDDMIEGLAEEETKPKYEEEKNGEYYSTPKYLVRPSGYQFVDENGNVINATKIVLEKKKKEYPKTYEECYCVLLERASVRNMFGYKADLMVALQKLLVCRDAYWKIAGEEMGLGKPWKPDWNNISDKYCIYFVSGYAWSKECQTRQCPFAFPTPEMRDAFKENFDPDIEICKELL